MEIKKPITYEVIGFPAVRTGLEPATSAVTGRHSNQLNYRTNTQNLCFGSANIGIKFNPQNFFLKFSEKKLTYLALLLPPSKGLYIQGIPHIK